MNRPASHIVSVALLAALASPALAGAATTAWSADDDGGRKVVRTRVESTPRIVVVGDDGEAHTLVAPGGRRGYLGVHLVELTDELRRHFGAEGEAGVLVSRIEPDSPAARAGLSVGDVLVAIDGEAVTSSWDVKRRIAPHAAGEVAELTVVRAGRERRLAATLEDRPARVVDVAPFVFSTDGKGFAFSDGTEWDAQEWEEFGREMGRLGEKIGREVGTAMEGVLADPEIKALIEAEVSEQRELGARRRELEARLREVEQRLRELESRLDDR
jgi:membrane-associated protease RseP (regulator of RpoE activity)